MSWNEFLFNRLKTKEISRKQEDVFLSVFHKKKTSENSEGRHQFFQAILQRSFWEKARKDDQEIYVKRWLDEEQVKEKTYN